MQKQKPHIEAIVSEIRSKLHAAKSLPALAREAGLHRNTLYGFAEPDWNPRLATLRALDAIEKERG